MADKPTANSFTPDTSDPLSTETKSQIDVLGDNLLTLRERIDAYMKKIEVSQAQSLSEKDKKKPPWTAR